MEHTYLELPGQSVYAKGGKIGYLDEESLSVIPVSEARTVSVTDVEPNFRIILGCPRTMTYGTREHNTYTEGESIHLALYSWRT